MLSCPSHSVPRLCSQGALWQVTSTECTLPLSVIETSLFELLFISPVRKSYCSHPGVGVRVAQRLVFD